MKHSGNASTVSSKFSFSKPFEVGASSKQQYTALVWGKKLPYGSHPKYCKVMNCPNDAKEAVSFKDTMNLFKSCRVCKPMETLTRNNDINACIRKVYGKQCK
ncbi:hypothetical protein P5673_028991 [Acropora cervicornis]|uniref:Uncharacterized protein n=1 Tax=Acropora cervicornis TaxID=6130 RepID=A0AAD9PWE1_ACRCE|nr:hypothetical protein P5673_028991 [Acropora cervicornis]